MSELLQNDNSHPVASSRPPSIQRINPDRLTRRSLSFRTVPGKAPKQGDTLLDLSQVQEPSTHVQIERGKSYSLTDPSTGKVNTPKSVHRVEKNLRVTLPDGREVEFDDFFVNQPGPDGTPQLRPQAQFVFHTRSEANPYWIIDEQSDPAYWTGDVQLVWPTESDAIPVWMGAEGLSSSAVILPPQVAMPGWTSGLLALLGLGLAGGGGGGSSAQPPALAPQFSSATSVNVAENLSTSAAAYTAQATPDKAGKTIVYSLSGVDSAFFQIDPNTGVVTFITSPDADAPADAGHDNIYNITVTATDSAKLATSQNVSITVTDLADQPPVFAAGVTVSHTIDENTPATQVIHSAEATPDITGATLSYALSGTDSQRFTVDAQGQVRFKVSPDADAPADADHNNVYDLVLTATDPAGQQSSQTLHITVADLPDQAPTWNSTNAVSVYENTASPVYTAQATPDVSGHTLRYGLAAGGDNDLFSIDPVSGALLFKVPPDYENPADLGHNNVYDVTVTASDGDLSSTQSVHITVRNASDVLTFVGADSASVPENTAGTVFTAQAVLDAPGVPVHYSLAAGGDNDLFNINPDSGALQFKSPPNYENPLDAGQDNTYNLTIQANAGAQTASQSVSITVTNLGGAPPQVTHWTDVQRLDVQSDLVLVFDQAVTLSTQSGLDLRIVHDGGSGFHADSAWQAQVAAHQRDFSIGLSDSQQLSLSGDGLRLTIHLTGDFDFGSNYHLEVDAGAFLSRADPGQVNAAISSGLSFSTVTPGDVASAPLGNTSQKMSSTGALEAGRNYLDIQGLGDINTVQTLDLSGASVGLVYKDHDLAVGSDTTSGIGTGATGFNLQVSGWNANDLLYFDDQQVLGNAVSGNRVDAFGGISLRGFEAFNTPATGNVTGFEGALQVDPATADSTQAWIGFAPVNGYSVDQHFSTAVISA